MPAAAPPRSTDVAPSPRIRTINSALERLFERVANLTALPAVARDVLNVANNPDAGIDDLLPAIEQEPALATSIVKAANSSYYAPREPIGSLRSALTMLGMDQSRNLALTVIVGERFSTPSPVGELDRQRLWEHSICTAAAARTISRFTGHGEPEEAYLAGLVHDIGLLVLDQQLSTETPRVMVRFRTGEPWTDAEQKVLSFDHAQIGAYVVWRSGFPDRVVEAVDRHHSANQSSGEVAHLVGVVAVANYFVTRMGRGSIAHRRLAAPSQTVFDRLDLNNAALREVWAAIEEQLTHVGGIA